MPDTVILHYTAMETAKAACERLCDPCYEVSAHYLISEAGEVTQLVDEKYRAWHAGRAAWGNLTDLNSSSIGIELANNASENHLPPFPEVQMAVLENLLTNILDRWSIRPERVLGHSDIAPDRKVDPGPMFDWQQLSARGLTIWPGDAPPGNFLQDLATIGYRAQGIDDPCAELLAAFRLRYRPDANGPLDDTDRAMAAAIARDYPCLDVSSAAP